MVWSGERKADLPSDWRARRLRILERDAWLCRIGYADICIVSANEVDHVGDRTDHRDHMLRAACRPCHGRRTQGQSVTSRLARARRPREGPPGLIA